MASSMVGKHAATSPQEEFQSWDSCCNQQACASASATVRVGVQCPNCEHPRGMQIHASTVPPSLSNIPVNRIEDGLHSVDHAQHRALQHRAFSQLCAFPHARSMAHLSLPPSDALSRISRVMMPSRATSFLRPRVSTDRPKLSRASSAPSMHSWPHASLHVGVSVSG
eukprot:CAMPEP_0181211872 /NCGR_PEP_ID=MMETSP1096-20121128/24031_1 /TAXON_ID=156174 ORGANISM="Chrysochromulina ericina, Strain CCMP281" /NCGR_SAMPLE_ID=MMETSP1096 /ASSEMBLY_ACC=CAM_ASM_000453 /LENGTH=166 /DNA_ID=CAMNT_0023303329 /DNA_START=285 /DNA_END=786 /DNA_ORIENTATION=-